MSRADSDRPEEHRDAHRSDTAREDWTAPILLTLSIITILGLLAGGTLYFYYQRRLALEEMMAREAEIRARMAADEMMAKAQQEVARRRAAELAASRQAFEEAAKDAAEEEKQPDAPLT